MSVKQKPTIPIIEGPVPEGWEIIYHGRAIPKGTDLTFKKERPVFCADNPEDAQWYGIERGQGAPTVHAVMAHIVRPASRNDLLEAIKATNADEVDVQKHSPYEGYNEIDYLYVPKVIKYLQDKGFDSYKGWDVLTNYEIRITVVLNPESLSTAHPHQYYDEIREKWVPAKEIHIEG